MSSNNESLASRIERFDLDGGKMPRDLRHLVHKIETEAEEYPDRHRSLESLRKYISNGNFDMARHAAEKIVERQRDLRASDGQLPLDLQRLLGTIEAEAEEYPDRHRSLESLRKYISNGNFDMARHAAEKIVERQRNLRASDGQLPPDLQRLLDTIEAEAEEYPDRHRSLESLRKYISNGNFDMARHAAEKIVERQRNLRASDGQLPPDLQRLLDTIEAEAEEYPDRHRSLESLRKYISNGNFDMARHVAGEIVKRQQALGRSKTHSRGNPEPGGQADG